MAYDLGDTVPLTVTVRDEDGAPTNAAGVTLVIQKPDGTTETPIPVSPTGTGVYQHDYVPAAAGRYAYRFAATNPTSAFTDVFDVREAFPLYLISLQDARNALRKEQAVDDEEIRTVVEAATHVIERHIGEKVVRRAFTETVTADGGAVWLVNRPLISVTSVTSSTWATWDPVNLEVDLGSGRVSPSISARFYGRLTFTGVCGYQIVPAHLTEAAEEVVKHLWSSERGQFGPPEVGGLDTPGEGFTQYGSPLTTLLRTLLGPPAPLVA